MTDAQTHFIELLRWTRKHGFQPSKPSAKEIFLDPFTRRMCRHSDLKPHQAVHALWIPSKKGLEELGLTVETKKIGGMTIAKLAGFHGSGPTEKEALLSTLNQARLAFVAQ